MNRFHFYCRSSVASHSQRSLQNLDGSQEHIKAIYLKKVYLHCSLVHSKMIILLVICYVKDVVKVAEKQQ